MIYSIAHALVHGTEASAAPEQRARRLLPKRTARKGLHLAYGERKLYFQSLDDFSFAIESRTSIPASVV